MTPPENRDRFPLTQWGIIRDLRSGDDSLSRPAIEKLCTQYQFPLYCYIRRRGFTHHDTQDALQDFLATVLRREVFERADPGKGRLRALLCVALNHFLLNRIRDSAGRNREISTDAGRSGEVSAARYHEEQFSNEDTPEQALDRGWVRELLQRTLQRLNKRYIEKNCTLLFDTLKPVLLSGGSLRGEDTPALAARLGLEESTLRVALSRLLRDFREALRQEVTLTVSSPEEVDAELGELLLAAQGH